MADVESSGLEELEPQDALHEKMVALEQEVGHGKIDEIIEFTKRRDQLERDERKKQRVEREREDLLAAISSGNYRNKKERVAFVLNMFPKSRNSDVTLSIKFWETFQSDIYDGGSIEVKQLFKLERLTTIARIRAKIQNEYGLFRADQEVRRRRRALEEEAREVMGSDVPSLPIIHIYADETGKTADNVIVGSVWFLEGIATVRLYNDIDTWKESKGWRREFHFARVGKRDLPVYKDFVDFLCERAAYLSFKAISVNTSGSSRAIENTVMNLYRHLILRGTQHEIETGRATLPRELFLTMDKEDSIDALAIADLKQKSQEQMGSLYQEGIKIASISTVDSRLSYPVQIADLISGAINRRLNHGGERNHKDELSDYIIEKFSLVLNEEVAEGADSAVLLSI